jgi:hypothetical protein
MAQVSALVLATASAMNDMSIFDTPIIQINHATHTLSVGSGVGCGVGAPVGSGVGANVVGYNTTINIWRHTINHVQIHYHRRWNRCWHRSWCSGGTHSKRDCRHWHLLRTLVFAAQTHARAKQRRRFTPSTRNNGACCTIFTRLCLYFQKD